MRATKSFDWICSSACFVDATDENVTGTWVFAGDPGVELVLTPDRNSVERLGSLEVRGHWTIVHTWDTGGPTMPVELVAFKYGRISQDPNQRSSGLIRRLPFTTKLLVRGVQGEIELTKR